MIPTFLTTTLSVLKAGAEGVVTINDLYHVVVEQLQKIDSTSLNIQKVLHQSLLAAVGTLSKVFTSDDYPYLKSISNSTTKDDEQKRIREIFAKISNRFPRTGTLLEPVELLLEDSTQTDIRKVIADLGINKELDELPSAGSGNILGFHQDRQKWMGKDGTNSGNHFVGG